MAKWQMEITTSWGQVGGRNRVRLFADHPIIATEDSYGQDAASILPDVNLFNVLVVVDNATRTAIEADTDALVLTVEEVVDGA